MNAMAAPSEERRVLTVRQIAARFPRFRGWTDWYRVAEGRALVRFYIVNGKAIRTKVQK
ncbi:hypothetical protein [Planktothrix phage Pra-JY27]|nr:hypothetical protein [Planktothrix phage Pag-Yong1]WEV89228.1 hypothetical protein [Synechococcus phage MinM2]